MRGSGGRTAMRLFALCWLLGCGQAAAERLPEPPTPAPEPEPIEVEPRVTARTVTLPAVHEVAELPATRACIPASEGPFGVLYAFDGDYYLDQLALCQQLAAMPELGAWIVVAVPSTEARTELLARHPERLAEAIEQVYEPALAELVPLAHDAAHRALIGYSYGGLAALEIALAQPERYGRVIAQSPSVWFAGRRVLGRYARARTVPARLFVDVGALEGDPGQVVPYMVDDARALIEEALAHGLVFGRDVALREVPGQAHDMALAGARLPEALRFALGTPHMDEAVPDDVVIRLAEPASGRLRRTLTIDARFGDDVLSWPFELAELREDEVLLERPIVRTEGLGQLTASVRGVPARLP